MSVLNENYDIRQGEFGLKVVTVTGRCTKDEAAGIKRGAVTRWKLVTIPNAAGAILKALDGSNPRPQQIRPSTTGESFLCVKLSGRVLPFAPEQPAGTYEGEEILFFEIVWQQVGGVV